MTRLLSDFDQVFRHDLFSCRQAQWKQSLTSLPPSSSSLEDLPALPPLMSGHPVSEDTDPFARAITGAGSGRLSAGDVVWSRAEDTLAAAFVFEPDVPPARCPEMVFLTMVAVVEALGTCVPPELALTHRWPVRLLANGGEIGGVRVRWSETLDETGAPLWLVVGLQIRLRDGSAKHEPGEVPEETTLAEEGASGLDRSLVLERVCRHLLSWIHTWEHDGFDPVRQAWIYRAEGYGERIVVDLGQVQAEGVLLGLDVRGNLMLKQSDPVDGTRVVMLDTALAEMELF